jgi:pyruvate dehydrogenase E2 component (dihydrolipoamide acetyltransferase)
MPFSVVMPALEMAQETGKLIAWRKQEGDRVSKGEPLLEIETDKAVVEVEAPADGVLAGISAQAGSDIPVGQTIAWIVAPGEKPPLANEFAGIVPAARAKPQSYAATITPAAEKMSPTREVRISPKARRLANELGVDVATIQGSGSAGEVLASDIQRAAAATPNKTAGEKDVKNIEVLTTVGRMMAERTTQSWTSVPHFFVSREVDATALNQYRNRLLAEFERAHNVRITHTDVLIAITARVLLKNPRLNGSWTAEGIRLHDHVNMGVAIAVTDGVVAGVIANAHIATIIEIARHRQEISERAQAGKLRPADILNATFTISNLGMYHVDAFSAIIAPPQAAILAVGSIADRVVALDGKPAVRPMMVLTISADHRVADGARSAIFLNELAEAMQDPSKVLT